MKPTAMLRNIRRNTLVLLMPTKARDQGKKELDTNSGSHHCKRDEFYDSLQSCSQIHSNASSNEIPEAKAVLEKEWEKLKNILIWQLTKVRNRKEVIEEARKKSRKVPLASLMDLCDLKNSKLESQYQKDKNRVALRGDIVKNDSGSYAVFTE